MDNLLKETLKNLEERGKQSKDVLWIGNSQYYFNWDDFVILANQEYDDGYGTAEVAIDMKVVGKDFWLERHEYYGSEQWEFKVLPEKPAKYLKPNRIIMDRALGDWSNSLDDFFREIV